MLTIHKLTAGREAYYLRLCRYYTRRKRKRRGLIADDVLEAEWDDLDHPYDKMPGEPAGYWQGKGAEFLGLTGTVEEEDLSSLMRGFHPRTGKALVKNAGVSNRCSGFDYCFSVPKSVSILWSRARPWMRQVIEDCLHESVAAGIHFLESRLSFCRTGQQGQDEAVAARIVVASFFHRTSRELDPQLHIHSLVQNVGIDEKGKTRALDGSWYYQYKMFLGAFIRCHLANRVGEELSLEMELRGNWFEIKGIPEKIRLEMSKRRKKILQVLQEKGLEGAIAASIAALDTRPEKSDEFTIEELLSMWQEFYDKHGFTEEKIEKIPQSKISYNAYTIGELLDAAAADLTNNVNHFTELEFQTRALQRAAAMRIPPLVIVEAASNYLEKAKEITRITKDGSEQHRFTTKVVLAKEKKLLIEIKKLQRQEGAYVPDKILEWVFKHLPENERLDDEQKEAVRHMCQGRGGIRIANGFAGTGKSRMLNACKIAFEKAGYIVIAAAPSNQAAKALEQKGVEADTIAMRMADFRKLKYHHTKHVAQMVFRTAQGKSTWSSFGERPFTATNKVVCILDEAGMVGLEDFTKISRHIRKGHATLLPTGDDDQFEAVCDASPFQSLRQRVGHTRITKVRRQQTPEYLEIANAVVTKDIYLALEKLVQAKRITGLEQMDEALEKACSDWAWRGNVRPQNSALLVSTNEQVIEANRICQTHRLDSGRLRNPQHSIKIIDTSRESIVEDRVYRDDRIILTGNSKGQGKGKLGITNGMRGTIKEIRGDKILVDFDDEKETKWLPVKDFKYIRLAYAFTNHRFQGSGIDYIHAVVGGSMTDFRSFNVQITRGFKDINIYTTKSLLGNDLDQIASSPLAHRITQAKDLSLASDIKDGLTPVPTVAEIAKQHQKLREQAQEKSVVTATKKIPQQPMGNSSPLEIKPVKVATRDITASGSVAQSVAVRKKPNPLKILSPKGLNISTATTGVSQQPIRIQIEAQPLATSLSPPPIPIAIAGTADYKQLPVAKKLKAKEIRQIVPAITLRERLTTSTNYGIYASRIGIAVGKKELAALPGRLVHLRAWLLLFCVWSLGVLSNVVNWIGFSLAWSVQSLLVGFVTIAPMLANLGILTFRIGTALIENLGIPAIRFGMVIGGKLLVELPGMFARLVTDLFLVCWWIVSILALVVGRLLVILRPALELAATILLVLGWLVLLVGCMYNVFPVYVALPFILVHLCVWGAVVLKGLGDGVEATVGWAKELFKEEPVKPASPSMPLVDLICIPFRLAASVSCVLFDLLFSGEGVTYDTAKSSTSYESYQPCSMSSSSSNNNPPRYTYDFMATGSSSCTSNNTTSSESSSDQYSRLYTGAAGSAAAHAMRYANTSQSNTTTTTVVTHSQRTGPM